MKDKSAAFLTWFTATGKPHKVIVSPFESVSSVALSHDSSLLLTAGQGAVWDKLAQTDQHHGVARLWDLKASGPLAWPVGVPAIQGKPRESFAIKKSPEVAAGQIADVAFCPDGKTFLTLAVIHGYQKNQDPKPFGGGSTSIVNLELARWDSGTGKKVAGPWLIASNAGGYFGSAGSALRLCPDGKSVLILDRTNFSLAKVYRFDLEAGKLQEKLGEFQEHDLQFSPDGKLAAVKKWLQIHLIQLPEWKPLPLVLKHQSGALVMAFSADSKKLFTATMEGKCHIWDLATGTATESVLDTRGNLRDLKFTADGKTMLTVNSEGVVRLWDARTLQPLGPEMPHQGKGHDITIAINKPGTHFLVHDQAGTHLYPMPVPVPANVKRILLWAQVLTGVELDAQGQTKVLTADQWQQRKKKLAALGGPPLPSP
jgi:WD40 repeat protein